VKSINLNDLIGKSKWFKWREALWLPRWKIYGVPQDESILENIEKTALAMDKVRVFFGKEIIITSWLRPEKYNELISGSPRSSHMVGLACDFLVKDYESKSARQLMQRHLKDMGIRMEKLETVHVHIDLNCAEDLTNDARYFKP